MENTGERARDIKDMVRWSNLNWIGIPEGREIKKQEAIFENIIAKNFPKPMKVSSHRFKKPK